MTFNDGYLKDEETLKDLCTFIVVNRGLDIDYTESRNGATYDQIAKVGEKKYYVDENKHRSVRYDPMAIEMTKYNNLALKVCDGLNSGYEVEAYINWAFDDNKIYRIPLEWFNKYCKVKYIAFPKNNKNGYEKTRRKVPCMCLYQKDVEDWMIMERKVEDWQKMVDFGREYIGKKTIREMAEIYRENGFIQ